MKNSDKCNNKVTADSIICNLCQISYLFEGRRVSQCPSGYETTKTQCLKCELGTFFQGATCVKCSNFCEKCSGSGPSQYQQCSEGFNWNQVKGCILSDFDLNPSFKPKKFVDPRTNIEKECNFSCDEFIDSSDLCIKCNPELNYFIKEGDRLRCYNRCPLYFKPNLSNQDPQSKYIQCVKNDSYTSDIEAADKIRNEAKTISSIISIYTKKDIQTKQCQKCASNCIFCNNDSSCIECEPDYYWNYNRKTSSPCHPSCKKCTGPLSKYCLFYAFGDQLFPNANGNCQETVFDPLPQQKTLSQNEIYGNLQVYKSFLPQNQKQNYIIEFSQKYSIIDPKWESMKMISRNSCTFQEFQNRFKYFQNNQQNCEEKDISQSTVGKNGDLVIIYSMLLSQSRAQISSNEVNPQILVEYAFSKDFFSSSYIYISINSLSEKELRYSL
ncbi:hypothetical protein ABPG72_007333 [Tetrahymena utriculariae]